LVERECCGWINADVDDAVGDAVGEDDVGGSTIANVEFSFLIEQLSHFVISILYFAFGN